ncbi:hypothetical protein OH77DRAFT_1110044 [Trametes cingulata]|nr:hypothetical protein OH77DRAFT_1110044 [Trametes cingulata]
MPNATSASHGHGHAHPSAATHTPQHGSTGPAHAPSTPIPTPAAAAAAGATAPAPRARAQNARKRAAQADDAAYHAAAGTKRAATDRADGDRERTKRKRVDASSAAAGGGAGGGGGTGTNSQGNAGHAGAAGDKDDRVSLIDFSALPTDALHRYLAHFDLIPDLDPSPLSVEDPGPPSSLLRPKSHVPPHGHALRQASTASPGPIPTGSTANRPRRDPGGNRRRSTRLVEEERQPAPPPVYGDIAEVDGVLAAIAERHFREQEVKEVDTLAAFMCAVQAKARLAA